MTDVCWRRLAACLAALSLALSGCSTLDTKLAVKRETASMRKGPATAPYRTITGFSEGLRCMDNLMITYGVRDLPMLVEDLADRTTKVNAGTRDMIISAISELSTRSRAIRLVTFGADVANLANFHANAESKQPYAELPTFDIRGSISQFDEALSRRQLEGGITFGGIGVGGAKSAEAAILAIDLNVINASNYSVVPGVTARNSVAVFKEGSGLDGEAQYRKLGVNFGMTLSRTEGRAQALRTLVELSVIELIGKLTRTPYWLCIGADPHSEMVDKQIADWYYALSMDGALIAYLQSQLTLRGAYTGPIDGKPSSEFYRALAAYRARLGLSATPKIDQTLLAAYLRATHTKVVMPSVRPASPTPSVSATDRAKRAGTGPVQPDSGQPATSAPRPDRPGTPGASDRATVARSDRVR